jgi:hypothetical protein
MMSRKFLPGCFLLSLFTFSAYAQVYHGKNKPYSTISFKGNTIKFSGSKPVQFGNVLLQANPMPEKVNNELVYLVGVENMIKPRLKGYANISAYILEKIRKELETLPDGIYALNTYNLTTDKAGKLIYFDYAELRRLSDHAVTFADKSEMDLSGMKMSITPAGPNGKMPELPKEMKSRVEQALYQCLLHCPGFSPAILPSGAKVYCCMAGNDDYNFSKLIKVDKHKVVLVEPGK